MYEAKVADILRMSNRDQRFLNGIEEKLCFLLNNLMGTGKYHKNSKFIPTAVSIWYYLLTNFGNLQTLGQEYTGIIRTDEGTKIPSAKVCVAFFLSISCFSN